MDLIQKLKDQVKPLGKKIVLPEYKDERVLKATDIILKEGFVTPVLVGNPAEIATAAKAAGEMCIRDSGRCLYRCVRCVECHIVESWLARGSYSCRS